MQNDNIKSKILIILIALALTLVTFLFFQPKTVLETEKKDFEKLPLATDKNEIEIILVGDIMLSRQVGSEMVKANDWTLPFKTLAGFLKKADITFGNLEAPFLDSGARVTEGLSFKTEPQAIAGLVVAGFDIVSTANNHAFDRGATGIEFTNKWLAENGIKSVGTGTTANETFFAETIAVGDTKIAFLAYTYFKKTPYVASLDIEQLQSEIQKLESKTDLIIVSMHAGEEYTHLPTDQQINFAHVAIDAGADIVVGHHPHWIQPIEVYSPTNQLSPSEERDPQAAARERDVAGNQENFRKGLIFYSLGNFVFDQEWSQKTKEGMMVKLLISNNQLLKADIIPIVIENYCCARFADEVESKKILNNINASSTILFK